MVDNTLTNLVLRLRQGFETLGAQLPRILSDPRAYPREAMLLAVMATLLVLMLAFAGFALHDTVQTHRTRRATGLRVRRRGRLTWWASAIVISGALVLAAALTPLVPAAGRLCRVCHAVEEQVVLWRDGLHASVSCYGCHAAPGIAGAVSASLAGAGSVVGMRYEAGTRGAVYDAGCLSCHRRLRDDVVTSTVRMRHSDVIDAAMACVTCHARVGHESGPAGDGASALPGLVERPRMSICLTCHDGATASAECALCHAQRPLDTASTMAPGVTDLRMHCEGCHAPETEQRCVACHGLVLPHPTEFTRRHAGLSYENPGLCTRCHEGASTVLACECHTSVNVHGTYSGWFPAHGPAALSTGPGGCNCHRPSSCFRCHDEVPFL